MLDFFVQNTSIYFWLNTQIIMISREILKNV